MSEIATAFETLRNHMRNDPEYAWSWHCNIAVPLMDAIGVSHKDANVAAAHLMSCLFDTDITKNRHYRYGKSNAQHTHEFRVEMDKFEAGSERI